MADEGDISFQQGPIFEGVSYTVIPADDLSEIETQELIRGLTDHGAVFVPLNEDTGRIKDYSKLTHIVATSIDFPDYEEAFLHMLHIVKPGWVNMSIMKRKATNPRQFSPDPCLIMSEFNITCADIPSGDKEAIHGGTLAMGGQYSQHLTKLVTHIIALSTDNDICEMAIRKKLRCKIVLPHWFDDCLKLQRRIDERPYLLPDPEILRKSPKPANPSVKRFDDIQDAIDPSPRGTPTRLQDPRRNKESVFKGKKLFLSSDLGIADHMRKSLADFVVQGKGSVIDSYQDANVVICKYRDGADFFGAFRDGKEIGNLGWLYYLITHNTWTSPTRRLLHYPVPRYPIKGFEHITDEGAKVKDTISISCYTGEARLYLENLVNAIGATFTKTLKQETTYLVTANLASEKCDAAKEWNVEVVNHLWLEDSYARGRKQKLSNQRYTTFPKRTNLGEVVGQTPIDRAELNELYMPEARDSAADEAMVDAGPLDGNVEREPTILPAKNMAVPKAAPKRKTKAPAQPFVTMQRDVNGVVTPVRKRGAAGKENETPEALLSTGTRAAKQLAEKLLKNAAEDIAAFQKESKRVGGVIHGRPRSSDGPTPTATRTKKRATPDVDSEGSEVEPEEAATGAKASKRARIVSGENAKLPPISQRLMVTKYQKWDERETQKIADKNKLRNLGIHITENPSECSILCAPRIVRTKKFVSALAAAPQVVNTEWLDYVLKHNKTPAEGKYLLDDRVEEERLGFKLEDALDRAASNDRKLLREWQIFCTEGVVGGWETYKMIIEANGGICNLYKGRLSMKASKRSFSRETQEEEAIAENQGDDEGDTLYLLSEETSTEKLKKVWTAFKELAEREDMVPKIVRTDWLLAACMRQRVQTEGGQYEIEEAMG